MTEKAYIPTLQDFIAYSRTNGFSRSDRFVANFTRPPGLLFASPDDVRELSLVCEEASFPGASIAPRGLRINGLTEFRPSTVSYGNEGITLQFIVDSKWGVRNFMEGWMNIASDFMTSADTTALTRNLTRQKSREVGWYNEYTAPIELYALVQGTLGANITIPEDGNQTVRDRALNKLKDIALDQVDRAKTEVQSRVDPRAVDILRDAQKILGTYKGADNPLNVPPAEVSVFNITIHEAWPREIYVQQTSHYNTGYHRLNVVFAYKHWTSQYFAPGLKGQGTEEPETDFIRETAIPAAVSVIANRAGILRARNIPLPPIPR
jgi:hypothetical protein